MWKNRVDYAIILFCALLFFLCFDGYLSLYVLGAVLLLPLLSLLLSLPALLGVRGSLSAELPETQGPIRAAKGQEIPLLLTVESRFPFACGRARLVLTVRNTLTGESQRETVSLTPGRRPVRVSHSLTSPRCGRVLVEVSRARRTDYLGLFSTRLPVSPSSLTVTFTPTAHSAQVSAEHRSASDSDGDRYSQTQSGDDPSEIFAFREYREGDRLSRIHWKLSQKSDELLVKELGLPISDRVFFLVEPGGSGEEADALLDAFATLSAFLSAREIPHRVGFRAGADNPLTVLEILAPEDMPPALDGLLAAGRVDSAPLQGEELPLGISRVLYLCAAPNRATLETLRLWPAPLSLTVLCAPAGAEVLQTFGFPVDHRVILPGQVPESLKGLHI